VIEERSSGLRFRPGRGPRSLGLISLDIFACNKAGEFDPQCVIGTPERAAPSDIIPCNLKHKFVRDGGSADTCNLGAVV
jgi:hypothetical protein